MLNTVDSLISKFKGGDSNSFNTWQVYYIHFEDVHEEV